MILMFFLFRLLFVILSFIYRYVWALIPNKAGIYLISSIYIIFYYIWNRSYFCQIIKIQMPITINDVFLYYVTILLIIIEILHLLLLRSWMYNYIEAIYRFRCCLFAPTYSIADAVMAKLEQVGTYISNLRFCEKNWSE